MTHPGLGGCPHVFVADLGAPELDEDDHHHLARVLRVRDGDPITISDGRGRWRPAQFAPAPEPVGDVVEVPAPASPVAVAFAVVKGGRPELIVQKLTEIGVDRIVGYTAERSVVRWDRDRAARNHERWQRIAREASMQSRRCRLPVVEPVSVFADLAREPGARRCEPGAPLVRVAVPLLVIGPEGGFSENERALLPAEAVGLGPNVLRTETAAMVAAALAVARREDGLRG